MRLVEGRCGRGLRLELDSDAVNRNDVLEQWFLFIPGANPASECFMFSIIDLDHEHSVNLGRKRFHGAKYEATVYALDPSKDPKPDNQASWIPLAETMAYQFPNRVKRVDLLAAELVHALADMDPSPFPMSRQSGTARLAARVDHWLEDKEGR